MDAAGRRAGYRMKAALNTIGSGFFIDWSACKTGEAHGVTNRPLEGAVAPATGGVAQPPDADRLHAAVGLRKLPYLEGAHQKSLSVIE